MDSLSKTDYTWEELMVRPLPDGVDPSRLERYLRDEDFEVGIFSARPSWIILDHKLIILDRLIGCQEVVLSML